MVLPIAAGDSATWIPALRRASTFSAAPPLPPAMMAPAWPMRRPGGAVMPAMNPTTGLSVPDALMNSAASSSARAADLADHDDGLGLVVGQKHLQAVEEAGPVDRIAADPDAGGLAESHRRGLGHRLVSEGARARDDPDLAARVDVSGHDSDLARAGRNHAGAVRPDEPARRALERALEAHHVDHRDSLGNADDQGNARIDGFEHRVRRVRRRDVDDRGIGARLRDRVGDGVEDRQIEMGAAALSRGDAADHLGTVGDGLLRMERSLGAREPPGR